MYALCVNATLKQIELCEVSVVVFAVLVDQDVYSSLKCHICNENVNFEWLSIALFKSNANFCCGVRSHSIQFVCLPLA